MDAIPAALRTLLVALVVVAASPAIAGAATIGVTTDLDVVANDGTCSLREAIGAANADASSGAAAGECAAGSGADTVAVPAGFFVTRIGPDPFASDENATGDFGIKGTVTIRGAGLAQTTIDGGGKDRVFRVLPGANASFSDVTISGGRTQHACSCVGISNGADGTGAGAGESVTQGDATGTGGGGGILNQGTTTIRDALLTDNSTADAPDVGPAGRPGKGGPAGGAGGASTGGDGGFSGHGGAVLNLGTLNIERTTLRANWTGDGGDASEVTAANGGSNPSGAGGRGGDAHGGNGGDAGGGGAIASLGAGSSLSVVDSRVAGNSTGAGGQGGAANAGHGGDAGVTCGGCSANGGAGGTAIAGNGGSGGDGGGILATGPATISRTTVTNNRTGGSGQGKLAQGGWGGVSAGPDGTGGTGGEAHGGDGGAGGTGAGIAATGTLTLDRTTIDNNVAGDGSAGGHANAGFIAGGDTGQISDAFGGDGGAGGTGGLSASGATTVTNVTIALNKGGKGGVGVGVGSWPGGAGNDVAGDGGAGGAGGARVAAAATFRHATVSGNSGGDGAEGGIATPGTSGQDGATGAGAVAGPASLRNSIVSANRAPSCSGSPTNGGGNISFPDNTCPGMHVDPLLGPLADNGGPTRTFALTSGSPAIDLVPATGAGCLATDQRGVARPQGAKCDAGAYEAVPAGGGGGTGGGGNGDGDGDGSGGGDGGGETPGDTQAPVLTHVGITNSVFTRHRGATAFRYTLSEPAKVTISIRRALPGRRKGDRCVKATKRLRHATSCTRLVLAGSIVRSSPAGATSVPFGGRIGSKRSPPGRYRAAITATDAAGNASGAVYVWFRIVPR
jgi:CSLREA domain-containing protein